MGGITAAFLREHVYPRMDAAPLLEPLHPIQSGKAWLLDCPVCERKRKAFYYRGGSAVICNARDNCGAALSIWDAVAAVSDRTPYEIAETLCHHAGVPLPDSESRAPSPQLRTVHAITTVLEQFLSRSQPAHDYLTNSRTITTDDIARLPLGFYPDAQTVAASLRESGADLNLCREWDVLPAAGRESSFANRIVGYWYQPDDSIRLWGRAIDGSNPKYRFARGMTKHRPYGFRRGLGPTIAVEGTMDKHALDLVGIPACATGGNQINAQQADYLLAAGVDSVVFLCDSGQAARDGAIRTMRACEPLGLRTSFSTLRENEDDVDTLRAAGRYADVQSLATHALNGGAYLARLLLQLTDEPSEYNAAKVAQIFLLRSQLTDASRLFFDRMLAAFGALPTPPGSRAVDLVAAMSDRGMASADIEAQLKMRYGITIDF